MVTVSSLISLLVLLPRKGSGFLAIGKSGALEGEREREKEDF